MKTVLPACLAAALAMSMVPAETRAQAADWRAAGGELFVRAASESSADGGGRVAGEAWVPPPVQPFAAAVQAAADRHGLDAKLLHALVVVESAYRPSACSAAGACGLTQLMPATARSLGVADRADPLANLAGGAAYLAEQIARFGDLRLALAAYNSGPARVSRLGRIPRIPETEAYVAAVVDCYLALTAGRSVRNARDCRREAR